MIIRHAILFLCLLCAAGSWSQTDVGYINVSVVKGPASENRGCRISAQPATDVLTDTNQIKSESVNPIEVPPRKITEGNDKSEKEHAFKKHYFLSHQTRTNNANLGFRLSKDSEKTINLVPLVDLGIQYNTILNRLNHRNGMGFLLEARPIKKSYVRIGGLVNISNSESLNPGNINLTEIGVSQKLWIMPMTRLAYTPNEAFCFPDSYTHLTLPTILLV